MVTNGARNIVYLSRSGISSPEAAELIEELNCQSVCTKVVQCDITDSTQLSASLADVTKTMPPIKGVIQGAMVLKDQIFSNMSHSSFMDCVRPKVQGSWALHNATLHEDLDFFLLLSSCASFWGNAGQANYAAGCNYQVSLAAHRQSLGLPATAIDIGKVSNVGFVAENAGTTSERNLVKLGLVDISERELLAMIEAAILKPKDGTDVSPIYSQDIPRGHLLTGCHSTNETDLPFWSRDPVFGHMDFVRPHLKTKTSDTQSETMKPLSELLAGAAVDVAEKHILQALMHKLSRALLMSMDDMNPTKPTSSFGIDSLVAVELRNWISREVKVDVPVFEILQAPSLQVLAGRMAQKTPLLTM